MQSFQNLVDNFYGRKIDIRDVIFEKFFHLFFNVDRVTVDITFPAKISVDDKGEKVIESLHDWFKDGKIPDDDVFRYFYTNKNSEKLTLRYNVTDEIYNLSKEYYFKIYPFDPDFHRNNYKETKRYASFVLPKGFLDVLRWNQLGNIGIEKIKNFFSNFEEVKHHIRSSEQDYFSRFEKFDKLFRDLKGIIIESKFFYTPLHIDSKKVFETIMPMKCISSISSKTPIDGNVMRETISVYEIDGKFLVRTSSYYEYFSGVKIHDNAPIYEYSKIVKQFSCNNLSDYIQGVKIFENKEQMMEHFMTDEGFLKNKVSDAKLFFRKVFDRNIFSL